MSPRRFIVAGWVLIAAFALSAVPADAQVGIGPRLTFVSEPDGDGSERFSGGFIRLGGGKTALEFAMDYRSGLNGDLTERVKDFPIQLSFLYYPVRARLSPYLLGGVGWYAQRVELVSSGDGVLNSSETTRQRGYHAGLGGEVRLHRHFGLYGDYRYTFIHFGDDDRDDGESSRPRLIPFAEQLKLSHEGSMFTWGATFYF
jgi:outer membrane protein with beta-barrel domain